MVDADDTAVGGVAGTQDFHAALVDVPGIGNITYLIETGHLNPYSQDCAGVDAWIDAIPDFSATCENFKADYFTNNGAGNDYTWNGLGGFENGPDPTVMGGDTSPATLAYDPDAEPPDDGGGDGDGGFPGSDYVASFSPFAIDGTAYDDPVPGMPASPQTFWIVSGGYGPSVVTADGDPIGGLFDDANLPFYVFLSDMDGALTTSFLDGGVGVSDCDEFEGFINSISGGELTPDCHAYKTSVFTPNGEEQDFTFAGFGGFSAGAGGPLSGTVAVADGYTAPPTLTYQVTPPGGGGGVSPYVASYSPLSLDGVPYDDAIFGCAGVVWVVAADQDPTCVQEDDTPFAAFPGGRPISIVLLTNRSSTTTMYIDSLVFDNPGVPGGPYDPDCPGFVTLAETVWSFTPTCDAFKSSALTPNGADEDFTWTGFDGFIGGDGSTPVADPIAVVDGYTDPPYLRYEAEDDDPPQESNPRRRATIPATTAPATANPVRAAARPTRGSYRSAARLRPRSRARVSSSGHSSWRASRSSRPASCSTEVDEPGRGRDERRNSCSGRTARAGRAEHAACVVINGSWSPRAESFARHMSVRE
ncbi:MAG: hypothetical protein M5U31_09840 [Acidimicrobiia bacterium]|nr:hypothetical protein [Acidimicrobiia bacterium]